MFAGCAAEAMELYVDLLPNSRILRVEHYIAGESGRVGTVKTAEFTLCGREFMCTDSSVKHDFTFTPSHSIFVECESRVELEHFFAVLSKDGQALMPLGSYEFASQYAWISDRFGVSWQLSLVA
jgi:predicted 3-demethylubiquinone-9 3-methyltransferase (glyoxalase superfamily)